MKTKYSSNLINIVANFLRDVNKELNNSLSEEKVYAMLDAFDPNLKHQLLIKMLKGNALGSIRIQSVQTYNKQKIQAIKELRVATGLGLREAKDVIEAADKGISEVPGNWSSDVYQQISLRLDGTGYEVL